MKPHHSRLLRAAALLVAGSLAAGPVLADKPANAGGKKAEHGQKADKGGKKHDKGGKHADSGGASLSIHFGDDARSAVRDYFDTAARSGNCPPGLAKKNNGCMPPGQAKKWARGAVLPPDVVIYPVPPELEIRIGLPPAGHKLVRVASDILMIAVGTNMVVDAIEDLDNL